MEALHCHSVARRQGSSIFQAICTPLKGRAALAPPLAVTPPGQHGLPFQVRVEGHRQGLMAPWSFRTFIPASVTLKVRAARPRPPNSHHCRNFGPRCVRLHVKKAAPGRRVGDQRQRGERKNLRGCRTRGTTVQRHQRLKLVTTNHQFKTFDKKIQRIHSII